MEHSELLAVLVEDRRAELMARAAQDRLLPTRAHPSMVTALWRARRARRLAIPAGAGVPAPPALVLMPRAGDRRRAGSPPVPVERRSGTDRRAPVRSPAPAVTPA